MPSTLPRSAVDHYNKQQAINRNALTQTRALWMRMGFDFDLSWASVGPALTSLVSSSMVESAAAGIEYLPQVLEETGQSTAGLAQISAEAFGGWDWQGRPVGSVLRSAVIATKEAVGQGRGLGGALIVGGKLLDTMVHTLLADAGRDAVHAGLITTPTHGYVRMLNPPSCSRCVILAGKWYRWNQGFDRHPECDCEHIPGNEDVAGDMLTDPYEYFFSLSEAGQDKLFGKRKAQAIRDGADIFRVENLGLKGMMRREGRNLGWNPPRIPLGELMDTAGDDRALARRLLEEQGYITGNQVREGNIGFGDLGLNSREASQLGAGTMGRGGTRVGATAAYRQAVRTGVRDQLDSATQTAAERRLHSALLIKNAVDAGRNPFGSNALTGSEIATARKLWERELKKLRDGVHPKQVYDLAELLNIKF